MKTFYVTLFLFQSAIVASAQSYAITYDPAGNRIHREVVEMRSMQSSDTTAPETLSSQFGEMSVQIFPNPTSGILGVEISNLPTGIESSLQLITLQGAEVYLKQGATASNPIDMSMLPSGQYLLVLRVDGDKKEWGVIKR